MKFLLLTLIIPFSLYATEINVEHLDEVTKEINHLTQSPSENCAQCASEVDQETIQKSAVLSQKEMTLSTNYIGGDDYVIALKRNVDTPMKIKLKIEYGERVCAKTTAFKNPLSGQIGFGCLFYQTEKRSKTIHLDFTKASPLEGDEHQSLRLVLHKDIDAASIQHQLKITDGLFDEVKKEKHLLGIFGQEYAIARKTGGSRKPAVIPSIDE